MLNNDERLNYLTKLKEVAELVEDESLNEGQNALIILLARKGLKRRDIFGWTKDEYLVEGMKLDYTFDDEYSDEQMDQILDNLEFTREELDAEIKKEYDERLVKLDKVVEGLKKFKEMTLIEDLVNVFGALEAISYSYTDLEVVNYEIAMIKYNKELEISGSTEKGDQLFEYTGISKEVVIVTELGWDKVWLLPTGVCVKENEIEKVEERLEKFLDENPALGRTYVKEPRF